MWLIWNISIVLMMLFMSWQSVALLTGHDTEPPQPVNGAKAEEYPCGEISLGFGGMIFLSPDTGYLTGRENDKDQLLKTTDGGKTWHCLYDYDTFTQELQSYEGNLYVIEGELLPDNSDTTRLLQSRDGGHTWQTITKMSGRIGNLHLFSSQCMTLVHTVTDVQNRRNREKARLLISNDGGTTWQEHPIEGTLNERSIFRDGKTLCFAVGNQGSRLYRWNPITGQETHCNMDWVFSMHGDDGLAAIQERFYQLADDTLIFETSYDWGAFGGGSYSDLYLSKWDEKVFALSGQYPGDEYNRGLLYSDDSGRHWQVVDLFGKMRYIKLITAYKSNDIYKLFYMTADTTGHKTMHTLTFNP